MEIIEASGRTLEEAVQIAAQQLGVGTEGVEYEIVEEGTKGFLGLGQSPTTVKAHVKEGYEPVAQQVSSANVFSSEEVPIEDIVEEAQAAPVVSGDAFVDNTVKLVGDIVKAMGIQAKAVLKSAEPDEVWIDVVGEDVAILIGKHGQTLDALQYLIGMMVNRDPSSKRRVIIDGERYRMRHQEMLERKAREYADAVKSAGKEAVLEPQAARDRRIVHMTLADDPDVYTYSEGEGDDRHVVISPKK